MMEKERIAELAHKLENKEDLLILLNSMKRDEMGENDNYYPFTIKHINYYCNPNNSFHRYKQFLVKKKTGGFRQITAPKNQSFMQLLNYINMILKSMYIQSNYAMGFTEGRSVVTNAAKHIGQNYILNIDLKDFFPSIHQARVWKRLQLQPFNFPIPIANIIAGMCSMKCTDTTEDSNKSVSYVLPQGAPTSPIITNMICDKLDRRLAGLAKRFGLIYTRYADDISFSSMHNVYHKDGAFFSELKRLISDQGFTINDKKTRLDKIGGRQEVTGLIVSNKLNVTQKYVRDIRNLLYIWDRYGLGSAYSKFYPKYKQDKGHIKKGNPDLINVLDGKLMYLKMVKGENDSVYQRLYAKFISLVESTKATSAKNDYGITYLETKPVLEFEKNNNTEIVITMSKDKSTSVESNKDNNKKAHRYAYFQSNGKKFYATVNKYITPEEEEKKKEILAISLCKDSQNKQFWFIHKLNKTIVKSQSISSSDDVDIDKLNEDLDNLLTL